MSQESVRICYPPCRKWVRIYIFFDSSRDGAYLFIPCLKRVHEFSFFPCECAYFVFSMSQESARFFFPPCLKRVRVFYFYHVSSKCTFFFFPCLKRALIATIYPAIFTVMEWNEHVPSQLTAAHCNTLQQLQHTATHYNTLQHTATDRKSVV